MISLPADDLGGEEVEVRAVVEQAESKFKKSKNSNRKEERDDGESTASRARKGWLR